jgi:hypothetical protein
LPSGSGSEWEVFVENARAWKIMGRIITDVFVESNYDMCSIDFLAQLLLFMTIAQGKSSRANERERKGM